MIKIEEQANVYDSARFAIGKISDVSAHLEDFDDGMNGSSVTDELNAKLDKYEIELVKILDAGFVQAFGESGKKIIKEYGASR